MDTNFSEATHLLTAGKIGILPTDTIYGIHGLAIDTSVVNRVYEVRHRNPTKPFIILIPDIASLSLFNIHLDTYTTNFLEDHWPNRLSVILPCHLEKFTYLHRGTNSLAFRIPKHFALLELLTKTGPLISTSANPEGQEPATTIAQAKKYFSNKLDFYVDEGELRNPPSTLIKINNNNIEVLRQGEVIINND